MLLGLITAFVMLDVAGHASLQAMRDNRAALEALCRAHPVIAPLAYAVVYIVTAAATLPINVPLALGAGALFGFAEGVVLVSFASAIGATLSMLASRFLLRDLVHARLGFRLAAMEAGFSRDGLFYLFALRLAPIAPYTVVNLLFGLLAVRIWPFYAITQLATFPTLAVFVNAGMRLDRLDSLSGILQPELIVSLLLLAALPLLARMTMAARARR